MSNKGFILSVITGLIIVLVLLNLGRCNNRSIVKNTIIHDTVSIYDTIIQERTVFRYKTNFDTVIITNNDTVYVNIPIDHKLYSDSIINDSVNIKWSVLYSGYKSKIDTFGISYTIQPTVIENKIKKGWGQFIGVGINASGGVGYSNTVIFSPYIGIGITYGFGYHF